MANNAKSLAAFLRWKCQNLTPEDRAAFHVWFSVRHPGLSERELDALFTHMADVEWIVEPVDDL